MFSMRVPAILSDYLESKNMKVDVWLGDVSVSELFNTAEECLRSSEFCSWYTESDVSSLREFIPLGRYGDFLFYADGWLTPNDFGGAYPPANLSDIISAGEEIVGKHDDDPDFPSKLFEKWITLGKLPRNLRKYSVILDVNDELWTLDVTTKKREAESLARRYAQSYGVVTYVFSPGGEAFLKDAVKFDGRR